MESGNSELEISGTHYYVILPVSENLIKRNPNRISTYQTKSHINLFKEWIHDNQTPKIQNITELPEYNIKETHIGGSIELREKYITKIANNIYENSIGFEILSLDFQLHLHYIKSMGLLLKILAKIQLLSEVKKKWIILYNVPSSEMILFLKRLQVLKDRKVIWSNQAGLLLIDNEHIYPLYVIGKKPQTFYKRNLEVSNYYFGKPKYEEILNFKNESDVNIGDNSISTNNLIPFETIIKCDFKNSESMITSLKNESIKEIDSPTIFEQFVDTITENEIGIGHGGFKLSSANMKIGEKVIVKNFYEADILFQNSFYFDRFSFLLAQKIIAASNNRNRILLIGYENYSELLLNRTKEILNSYLKDFCKGYIISKDCDVSNWQNIDIIKHSKTKDIHIAIIVPIGSTLSTNYKIFIRLKRFFESNGSTDNLSEENIIFNSVILLVRDENSPQITDIERINYWDSIIPEKRLIKYKYFSKPIFYFLSKEGCWSSILNDKTSFPKDHMKEELILTTNKKAINIINYLGHPIVPVPGRYSDSKYLRKFRVFLKYGHILLNQNHHLYYLDTNRFLETVYTETRNWLQDQVKPHFVQTVSEKGSVLDVLVANENRFHYNFVLLVNEILFNNLANIVVINVDSEYKINTINKYSYFRDLEGNIRFHYVDHALFTGDTLSRTQDYLTSIFSDFRKDKNEHAIRNIKFYSIICIVNRLSYYKKKSIEQNLKNTNSEIYSMIDLFVPPIKEPESECYICNKIILYRNVIKESVLDVVQSQYYSKIKDYEIKNLDQIKEYSDERFFDRLLLTHNIHEAFHSETSSRFKNNTDNSPSNITANILAKFFKEARSIYDKINLVKVLTSPDLNYYIHLRKYAFSIMLNEIKNLLDNPEYSLIEFNYLIVLMRQLAELKSNFIIRKTNIKNIWLYYHYFRKRLDIDFEEINEILTYIIGLSDRKSINLFIELYFIDQQNTDNTGDMFTRNIIERKDCIKEILLNKFPTDFNKCYSILHHLITNLSDISPANSLSRLYFFSDNRISNISRINKLLHNLLYFRFIYASLIKIILYKEESKSLWFELILADKNKNEQNVKSFNEIFLPKEASKSEIYENIFNSDIESKSTILKEYRSFLVICYFENINIYKKALSNIDKEIQFHQAMKNDNNYVDYNTFINDKDIKEILITKIASQYYFEHLNNYFGSNLLKFNLNERQQKILNSNRFLKLLSVYWIRKYLVFSNEPIEIKINQILKVFCKIMECDKAFFTIVKTLNSKRDENIYKIGQYEIAENEIPFELNNKYYTYRSLVDNYNYWVTYDAPPKESWKDSYEHMNIKNSNELIVFRLFESGTIETINSAITFIFINSYDKIVRKSRTLMHKENFRFLLLVKDVLQQFIKRNFDNDSFIELVNRRKKEILLEEHNELLGHAYRNFNHQKTSQVFSLWEEIEKWDNSIKYKDILSKVYYIGSNIIISDLYGQIAKDQNNISIGFSHSDIQTNYKISLIPKWFEKVLNSLCPFPSNNSLVIDNTEMYFYKKIDLFTFRCFLVTIIQNIKKHLTDNKFEWGDAITGFKPDVKILLDKNKIFIGNSIPNVQNNVQEELQNKLDLLRESILNFDLKNIQSTTLISIDRYLKSRYNSTLKFDFDFRSNLFYIILNF